VADKFSKWTVQLNAVQSTADEQCNSQSVRWQINYSVGKLVYEYPVGSQFRAPSEQWHYYEVMSEQRIDLKWLQTMGQQATALQSDVKMYMKKLIYGLK
jgi:hypothetical protein